MKFGGQGPNDFGPIGPQGFPGQSPYGPYGSPGPTPGGSIRNTLGAGLKSRGVFQKDGQINNLRGGFIGPKRSVYPGMNEYSDWQGGFQPGQGGGYPGQGGMYEQGMGQGMPFPQSMPPRQGKLSQKSSGSGNGGPFSFLSKTNTPPGYSQPRQLVLQSAQEGIIGNGVATITPDNRFQLVANLPQPQNFLMQGQSGTYAAYLVDNKGKNGFLAGTLKPIGNGVYQTQFQSPVPLTYYDKVVVSVENPQQLGQAPNGPLILKVKDGMGPSAFLNPMKKAGGSVWNKITGLFKRTPKEVPVPAGIEMLGPEGAGLMEGAAAGAGVAAIGGAAMGAAAAGIAGSAAGASLAGVGTSQESEYIPQPVQQSQSHIQPSQPNMQAPYSQDNYQGDLGHPSYSQPFDQQ